MHRFSVDELRWATNDFELSRIIDYDRYMLFYRGGLYMPPPRQAEYIDVAIDLTERRSYFEKGLRVLSELKHRNLLTLIGYCDDYGRSVCLVYAFPSGGVRLSEYLRRRQVLSWTTRLKICVGVARGLNYLHAASILYCGVGISNILLDDNLNAKILIPSYVAFTESAESDVHSFGVLLLDVLRGRSCLDGQVCDVDALFERVRNRLKQGKELLEEDADIVDPMLEGQITSDCLAVFLHIARQCVSEDPKRRPTMAQVVARLESLLALQEREKIDVGGSMEVSDSLLKQQAVHTASHHHWGSKRWQAKQDLATFHSGGSRLWRFSLTEMQLATKDFSPVLVIGEDDFNIVYKGSTSILDQQTTVAIKRWDLGSSQGAAEFWAEIKVLSEVRHKNVVLLVGYCNEDGEMILVYEYMPHGTLKGYLHNESGVTTLSWVQRLKICIGAAKGLDYLHVGTNFEHGVIHGNVNSSNILLDMAWEAKISDFGLSKVITRDESPTHYTAEIVGTIGYMDPAYFTSGILTTKADVYSLGVVLYEVLSGRRVYDSTLPEDKSLHELIQHYRDEGALNRIIDPKIHGQILPNCLDAFVQIADKSLHEAPNERPTMAEVVAVLEFALALQEGTDVDGATALWGDVDPMESLTKPSKRTPFAKKAWQFLFGCFKPLKEESYRHDKLSGEDDISNISEPSGREKSLNINFTPKEENPAAGPSCEAQDGEHTSKEVSADLLQLEYIQRVDVLNRKKDFLQLIIFYPMATEAIINFNSLIHKVFSLNLYIRRWQGASTSVDYNREIELLLQDAEDYLLGTVSDVLAYLPEDAAKSLLGNADSDKMLAEKPKSGANFELATLSAEESYLSDFPSIRAAVVASAVLRASECIQEMKIKKIGISGIHAEEVVRTLKNLSELISMFEVLLCVSVNHHTSIEEIRHDIDEQLDQWKKRTVTGDIFLQDYNCLLFLDSFDSLIPLHDLEFDFSERFRYFQTVLTTGAENAYCIMQVDLDIRTGDHLLPWNLFFQNVELAITAGHFSALQEIAIRLVEECRGHLLAIILLARALKGVSDVAVWELALHELTSKRQQVEGISQVMVSVLRFIWTRKSDVFQKCAELCASQYVRAEFLKSLLISNWIRDGAVETLSDGEDTLKDLISSFFLEKVGDESYRMRDETRVVLLTQVIPRVHPAYLKLEGRGLTKTPSVEEWNAREINLANNELLELPENPHCPILVKLFLQLNHNLTEIPLTFFNLMPGLRVLDLSSTSIKSLPPSVSKLTAIRELYMRDCDLLMELPPEIGALTNLKLFDLKGTELVYLPEEMENLACLEHFKVSLYQCADMYKESRKLQAIVPPAFLLKLTQLKALSIYVRPDGQWWDVEVKCIIDMLSKLSSTKNQLETLRLHFPSIELFDSFIDTKSREGFYIYPSLCKFRFIVGHYQEQIICRLPPILEDKFLQLEKCLKFTGSGEDDTFVINKALRQARALLLDRHWTLQSLSSFDIEATDSLKFCLLLDCNEMQTIVDGSEFYLEKRGKNEKFVGNRVILGSLQYLGLHYMKNIGCIWRGPIHYGSLYELRTLILHTCPELTTVFTVELLSNLTKLEYLMVKDCPKITSLVSLVHNHSTGSNPYLPNLKKISLIYMPELVSISNGVCIAPKLERMTVFDCPKLESFSAVEVSSSDLKVISGESHWWDALKWCEPQWTSGRPEFLTRAFVSLQFDGNLMDELDEHVNLLQQWI